MMIVEQIWFPWEQGSRRRNPLLALDLASTLKYSELIRGIMRGTSGSCIRRRSVADHSMRRARSFFPRPAPHPTASLESTAHHNLAAAASAAPPSIHEAALSPTSRTYRLAVWFLLRTVRRCHSVTTTRMVSQQLNETAAQTISGPRPAFPLAPPARQIIRQLIQRRLSRRNYDWMLQPSRFRNLRFEHATVSFFFSRFFTCWQSHNRADNKILRFCSRGIATYSRLWCR